MKKNILYITIAFTLLSCEKIQSKMEIDNNTTPIYKMSGRLNEQAFNYTVNDTNVFMSHGEEKMNGVTTFFTHFEDTENSSSLKISVIAPEKIYQHITDYSTEDRVVNYLLHEPGCYYFGFTETPANPPLVIHEQDGNFVNEPNIDIEGYGIYNIPIRFKGLSNETFNYTINHGFEAQNLLAEYVLTSDNSGIKFHSVFEEYKHEWFLDGEKITENNSGSTTVLNGVHTLVHIMSDNFGNRNSARSIFYTHANNIKWTLKTEECIAPPTSTTNFERLVLEYTKDGEVYSSAFSEENINHTFKIKNTEYFLDEINNASISIKFDVEFSGTLHNADKSKKIMFSEVTGTCKYKIQ